MRIAVAGIEQVTKGRCEGRSTAPQGRPFYGNAIRRVAVPRRARGRGHTGLEQRMVRRSIAFGATGRGGRKRIDGANATHYSERRGTQEPPGGNFRWPVGYGNSGIRPA